MPDLTDIRYASNGGVHLAYRVMGDGPSLVWLPNFATNINAMDSVDVTRRFFRRLSERFRFIFYDQRGTGMSDRVPMGADPLSDWVSDALTVLDAADADRAIVLGTDSGGPIAISLAARHPERVSALVLCGSHAALMADEDFDIGLSPSMREQVVSAMAEGWGNPDSEMARWAIPAPERETERRGAALVQRQALARGDVRPMLEKIFDLDVRNDLETISTPTLVLHRSGDRLVARAHARYLAGHIARAEFVELPGDDHYMFIGDVDRALAEVSRFCGAGTLPDDTTRTLAVLVFVDISGSTVRAASEGDRHWRELLDGHEALVRDQLQRYGGKVVKWIGDGVLAVFSSPTRAIRCGLALTDATPSGLQLRVGIHAGEVEQRDDDIAGITVHIAQRIESQADPGEVLVSRTVHDLVAGSDFTFVGRGEHTLKGVEGSWRLFAVRDR